MAEPSTTTQSTIETPAVVLGQLVPLVTLDKAHDRVELTGGVKHYFYVHKLVGYVLASFLVAGLAGLTQK
jgi:hypothetical protein